MSAERPPAADRTDVVDPPAAEDAVETPPAEQTTTAEPAEPEPAARATDARTPLDAAPEDDAGPAVGRRSAVASAVDEAPCCGDDACVQACETPRCPPVCARGDEGLVRGVPVREEGPPECRRVAC